MFTAYPLLLFPLLLPSSTPPSKTSHASIKHSNREDDNNISRMVRRVVREAEAKATID
jgi:hypothetical protein